MNKIIRTALFAGTALAAVATGMPQEASAQSQTPGFFGSLSGWYYFNPHNKEVSFKGNSDEDPFNNPKGGPGGKIYAGYRFAGSFDIAFGLQGTWLGATRTFDVVGPDAMMKSKAHYWAVDGELGYNTIVAGLGVRLFAGARFARFDHDNHISAVDMDGMFFKNVDQRFSGVGPRVGIDFSTRIGNSNFTLFGDAAGSLLFGKLKENVSVSSPPCGVDCSDSESISRKVLNLEGQLGLGYEIAPLWTIGAGYRAEYWRHVAEFDSPVNRFMHGPFVRVAYNFGAPPAMPMAAIGAPPPGQPAMTKQNFIVFFDFDRSNVTAEGQKTISNAAAAAKSGNAAQVSVTGHADRSGSEQYNLALSMRRAEVVKAGLIELGVPAALIVVVAKGESQPLVNTADGVREPQNRRVEILI